MILAMDAMGGDHAPAEPVKAAADWVAQFEDRILLVGPAEVLAEELRQAGYNGDRIEIIHASQVVDMDESPAMVMRRKKDSSIVVATQLVQSGRADAVLSCGSTGAQMVAALFILGRMEGVDRPPVIAVLPKHKGGHCVLLDVGANVDCKPEQLVQFARLGHIFAHSLLDCPQPVVALLNNGSEEGKGNAQTQAAFGLLQRDPLLHFVGNVEGREIFNSPADVVVCDGFVGNIMLKTIEGTAGMMATMCMQEFGRWPGAFAQLDYTQQGGSPLLGVNGISVVCHGSSRREAIFNGIRVAQQCHRQNLIERQQAAMVSGEYENQE